jgi:hypothetical protein
MKCPIISNKKSISNHNRAGKYHWSEEAKLKRMNEGNPLWKGNNVGRISLHEWIRNHKSKPDLCEECHKNKPFDLANISGQYLRDINDFRWICRKCHMLSDNRMKNLKNNKESV